MSGPKPYAGPPAQCDVVDPDGARCPKLSKARTTGGPCPMHARRIRLHGDPGRVGELYAPDGSDEVSYHAVHRRLARERGKPSAHRCVGWRDEPECDRPAAEWSLDEMRAGGRVLSDGDGRRWSPALDDYDPRCLRCHRRHDRDFEVQRIASHFRHPSIGIEAAERFDVVRSPAEARKVWREVSS